MKVVANVAVGYNNIDVPYAKSKGIITTNLTSTAGQIASGKEFSLGVDDNLQIRINLQGSDGSTTAGAAANSGGLRRSMRQLSLRSTWSYDFSPEWQLRGGIDAWTLDWHRAWIARLGAAVDTCRRDVEARAGGGLREHRVAEVVHQVARLHVLR